jgi:hypothetical protein
MGLSSSRRSLYREDKEQAPEKIPEFLIFSNLRVILVFPDWVLSEFKYKTAIRFFFNSKISNK